jgi:hypothetical protein
VIRVAEITKKAYSIDTFFTNFLETFLASANERSDEWGKDEKSSEQKEENEKSEASSCGLIFLQRKKDLYVQPTLLENNCSSRVTKF